MPTKTTRQKILAYIARNRAVSPREIARALKLAPPNVRHHLSVLAADGRVERSGMRARGGRGRPETLYSVSEAYLGDNLAGLADALLSEAGGSIDLDSLGRSILGLTFPQDMPTARRLNLLIARLNDLNYQSHWEAAAGGPRVVFAHCPYSRILAGHPELCRMDASMLGDALRGAVRQESRIQGRRGVCGFSIR